MQDLNVDFIWRRPRNVNTYIPFHSHNFYELVYYTYGSGITTIGDTSYSFHPGSFILIPPHTEHDEHHNTNSEVICLGFSCASFLPQMNSLDSDSSILSILTDILRETAVQGVDFQTMILAKLNELYVLLQRIHHPNQSVAKNFDHIINYMNENYHERIHLSSFAEELHISYDYFQHKFKQITGYSPQQFLLNRRLSVSAELLSGGGINCTEIAYRCGFSTPAQFSMLFKKKYGISPLAFKKGT